MPNTILEKLQEKYPDATGINDARNIAEAVACINGTGGRGANAIAAAPIAEIALNDGSGLTAPEDKVFSGWGTTDDAAKAVKGPIKISEDTTLYAIWADEEPAGGLVDH